MSNTLLPERQGVDKEERLHETLDTLMGLAGLTSDQESMMTTTARFFVLGARQCIQLGYPILRLNQNGFGVLLARG
jgi:hypothetical protein